MNLLIQIPAFNEEETIGNVIDRIPKQIIGIDNIEVLVIDDGSTDATSKISQQKSAIILRSNINMGVGWAMRKGFSYAIENEADILVTIDADGQFNPEDIPILIKPIILKQSEFVTCSRFLDESVRPNMPWVNLIGNKILALIISKTVGYPVRDVSCGFRAFSRNALLLLNLFGRSDCNQEVFINLAKHGVIVKEIPLPVEETKRTDGKSRVLRNIVTFSISLMFIMLRSIRDANPFLFFGAPALLLIVLGIFFYLLHWIFIIISFNVAFLSRSLATVGWVFVLLGLVLLMIAFIADMIDRNRLNQEEIIYLLRKKGNK